MSKSGLVYDNYDNPHTWDLGNDWVFPLATFVELPSNANTFCKLRVTLMSSPSIVEFLLFDLALSFEVSVWRFVDLLPLKDYEFKVVGRK